MFFFDHHVVPFSLVVEVVWVCSLVVEVEGSHREGTLKDILLDNL